MDDKLTKRISAWIDADQDDRNIQEGAEMLLQLNRNRFLYNNILAKPERYIAKLEYELRKFNTIRLDNMTIAEVVKLDDAVMPNVANLLSNECVVNTDDELSEALVAKGRRADHDYLPAEIQELWNSNLDRLKVIKQTFEQLKLMSNDQPCDRYEYLKILDESEKVYRKNLEVYDNYILEVNEVAVDHSKLSLEQATSPSDLEKSTADVVNSVNSARKFISKNKKVLAKFASTNDAKANALRAKIQESVATIQASGTGFSVTSMQELSNLGIIF
ncbi:MAG: hypothetical protein RRY02_08735 [Muribaculaceae bacterium]